MRCFIAVDVSENVRSAATKLQEKLTEQLKLKHGDVKWIEPENMHLTLKFLGEVKDSDVPKVCQAVAAAAKGHHSFQLQSCQLGSFGGKSARVVWLGSTKGTEELAKLAEDVEDQFEQAGWPRDPRGFSSHLTICRVKNFVAGRKLSRSVAAMTGFEAGMSQIDAVYVYESQLTPKGPIYTRISSHTLK